MKNTKKLSLVLFLLTPITLTGCSGLFHLPGNVVSTSSVTTQKKLVLKSLPTADVYYVGQGFDTTGLVIEEETYENGTLSSTNEITDYTLTIQETSTVVTSSFTFTESGGFNVVVSKDNDKTVSFSIDVEDVQDYSEKLLISSYPKTGYTKGETFSLDGLVVKKKISYVTDKKHTSTKEITNYTLKIIDDDTGEESDATDYVFNKIGNFTVSIQTTDTKPISTSFTVSVGGESHLHSLESYTDDSIAANWTDDTDKVTLSFTKTGANNTDKGYITPSEIGTTYTFADAGERSVYNWHYTPSTGKVSLLVVPVITPGDEELATEENWNLIKKCFFGKKEDMHFESLHSYYYQSSFEQLDFTGGVTGYFNPASVSNTFSSIENYTETNIARLPQLALDWAVSNYGIDPKDYDSNKDGYVDGVWLIYLHSVSSSSNFWAFTSTNGSSNGTVDAPVANTFGWAGLGFLNDEAYSSGSDNEAADAHVLIHETGHMLGLSDYYSYSQTGYAPLGTADMMDNNIGDHNPYSKLLLGWVKPYIVTGNATIHLSSDQYKNNVILLPYDDKTYAKDSDGKYIFNPFDEYLVLDLYNDNNLNYQNYDAYYAFTVKATGVRLYHVDSRLAEYTTSGISLLENPDSAFEGSKSILRVINNSESGDHAESSYLGRNANNAFDEIRWISADGTKLNSYHRASASSLFTATGKSSFSFASYASQFNTTREDDTTLYFNNKKACSLSFNITSLTD